MRVGIGYDAHRLVENRDLIIGGVKIPYEKGLLGHSDADVLLHAVCDSLLGASGLGDIGKHFPDKDEKYKGISSLFLLENTVKLLDEKGYYVVNVDCTVIAQAPKMSPFIEEMKINIEKITKAPVNVKATTEEKMGFTGSGEGISAQAVSLINEK